VRAPLTISLSEPSTMSATAFDDADEVLLLIAVELEGALSTQKVFPSFVHNAFCSGFRT